MVSKNFEETIAFHCINNAGVQIWLPLVQVSIINPTNGTPVEISLLFDTGASTTTLRADLYPLLGLNSWDQGHAINTVTANGVARNYQYNNIEVEVFGKRIRCPICLALLPNNPLFVGLLGRNQIFNEFGFGFWEGSHALYVTLDP